MIPTLARAIPFAFVLATLAAACGDAATQSTGPQRNSTVWMETIVAEAPTDPAQGEALLGQCLSRTPTIEVTGAPACLVLEGRHGGGSCACDPAAARRPVDAAHAGALDMAKDTSQAQEHALDCFCEVTMLTGVQRDACENDASSPVEIDGQPVDGVCYVDATLSPPLGNPALTKNCAETEKRLVRFVGKGAPVPSTETGTLVDFVICQQTQS